MSRAPALAAGEGEESVAPSSSAARQLKPSLPLRDEAGLPIDHELELEIRLDA